MACTVAEGPTVTGKYEDVESELGGTTTERFLRSLDLQVGLCCATTSIVGYRIWGGQEEVGLRLRCATPSYSLSL